MKWLITCDHKLHDNGRQTTVVEAQDADEARANFEAANPSWNVEEVEPWDD